MDKHYDIAKAAITLEALSKERRAAIGAVFKAEVKHLSDLDADVTSIVDTGNKSSWRMCVKTEGDEVMDEVVFRVQGILIKNNLVPKNTDSCPVRKVGFICQHIEICGLESDTFKEAVAKTEEVNDRFAEHFSSVTVLRLARPKTSLGAALSASNRLFTHKTDAPTEQDNEFAEGVDPTGVLDRLKTRDLIHAPDNMVRYYKCVPDPNKESKVKYETTVPGIFKAGDIVEVQLSFVGIQTGHHEVKVTTRLQAVTLLDASFTKAATVARNLAKTDHKPQQAVRRKVGYFYEDEEESGKAAKRIQAQVEM
ncbi:hypothetical protein B0H13DRAFT_2324433 [Mycena leptocephala]|nr:hypothetical protein B0H13DRAFT_2324433 [Mycena leptocephala]